MANQPMFQSTLLSQNPSKLPMKKVFSGAIFVYLISYLTLFRFSYSNSITLFSLLENSDIETSLNNISQLSIHLHRKGIQASSIKDQVFPMLVSRDSQTCRPLHRANVDLIFVIDVLQHRYLNHSDCIQHFRDFLKSFLPLMSNHDRLSVVFLDGLQNENPILSILPLTNTTHENREKIISDVGDNILRESQTIETPLKILDEANRANEATGIFLISHEDRELINHHMYKGRLGLRNVKTILTSFSNYLEDIRYFEDGLTTLQNGVDRTRLLIKPEDSYLFKGVELLNRYKETIPGSCGEDLWISETDGPFVYEDNWLPLGLKEFVFDLKIPRTIHALPSEPIEDVKIASCQLTFTLLNGSEVVKNADLTVKIVGEGKQFIHEEESPEVVKNLYRRLGERLLQDIDYVRIKDALKRYKESLENSFVKDDEGLQNIVKETEEFLRLIENEYALEFI